MNKLITQVLFLLFLNILGTLPCSQVDQSPPPKSKRTLIVESYCIEYNIPSIILFCIQSFYGDPFKYRNKKLPKDLSGENLSGFDFTGCQFTITNLTCSNLNGAILTRTTCYYQKALKLNYKLNACSDTTGDLSIYQTILKDLGSISQIYLQLTNDTHKAQLLHIASGMGYLPFYEKDEFYIKRDYWYCALLILKEKLNQKNQKYLSSLNIDHKTHIKFYCWTTEYPQNKIPLAKQVAHADFQQYLDDFTNGITQYQCKSKNPYGAEEYQKRIEENIGGLSQTYDVVEHVAIKKGRKEETMKAEKIKKEICQIALDLSKSYQVQQRNFLYHYLFYQHQLIHFKKKVKKFITWKNSEYINYSPVQDAFEFAPSWHRSIKRELRV